MAAVYRKTNVIKSMKKFTTTEIRSISSILIVLFAVTFLNMAVSLRRGRDATRKNDISSIQKALDTYYQKYRIYPESTDSGLIVGCFDDEVKQDSLTGFPLNPVKCEWGQSTFEEMRVMPRDPNAAKGTNYKYVSDGKGYYFYVAIEGKDEAEYTQSIANKNLQCGNKICNYGRSDKQ